jgi:tol-pal system protein YbgF
MKKLELLFLVGWVFLSLPVLAAKDTKLILDEVQKLTQQFAVLDGKINDMASEMSLVAKKIIIIEEKMTAVARNQADLNESKETTLLSLQFMKEELNEVKNAMQRLSDRLLNMPTTSNSAPASSEPQIRNESGGVKPPVSSGPVSSTPVRTAVVQDSTTGYYAAYSDYLKENYSLAIEGFRQYIKSFPESGLAVNSLYWIGECHYAQKKYIDALNTFNELISRYRDGDKADKIPAAMLKKGFTLIELGRQSDAVNTLRELVSRFPLQEEAALAKQKLKEISEQ